MSKKNLATVANIAKGIKQGSPGLQKKSDLDPLLTTPTLEGAVPENLPAPDKTKSLQTTKAALSQAEQKLNEGNLKSAKNSFGNAQRLLKKYTGSESKNNIQTQIKNLNAKIN